MIINNIKLENFKSHQKSSINFNEGVSLILGQNGSGKSSILEAIGYSFFKEFTGKIDNLMRKPTDEKDIIKQMLVTVHFTHNNIQYQLKRGRKKSGNIAELRFKENDSYVLKCKGDTNVTNDIKSILEIDHKSFTNAVYIKQGDITELIDKSPADRKELITKLLNIDSLEKAWNESKNVIQVYKDQINENNGRLAKENEINENLEKINIQLKEDEETKANLKPEKEELEKNVEELEKKIKEIENKKAESKRLTELLNNQQKGIDKAKQNQENTEEKIEEIEKAEEENKSLEKEIIKLDKLKEAVEHKNIMDNLQKEQNIIIEKINEIKQTENIIRSNKEYHEKYEELNEEIAGHDEEIKKLQDMVTQLNLIKKQKTEKDGEKDILFREVQNGAAKANNFFGTYFKNAEEIEQKINEEKEKTKSTIKSLNKNIDKNNVLINTNKNDLKNTRKSLNDLINTEDKCPICQSEISEDKHKELEKTYRDKITDLEIKIETLTDANKNQEKKKKEKEDYLLGIESINISEIKLNFHKFNECNNELNSLEEKIKELSPYETSLENLNKTLSNKKEVLNELKTKNDEYVYAVNKLKELKDIDELNSIKEDNDLKIKKERDICQDIVRRYAIKDDINITIKRLEKQKDKYNQNIGLINNKNAYIEQKDNLISEINEYQKQINDLNESIIALAYDEETYHNTNNEYQKHSQELKDINKRIIVLETNIENYKEQVIKYKEDLKDIEKIVQEQKNLDEYIKLLEDIREMYSKDGVQKYLRDIVRPAIEKYTMDIFSEFDFEYSSIKLDENYEIEIENNKETLELGMLSGGEKIVIALALRLGIANVISKNKTELLILDEPTIHLDDDRRARLIEILRDINLVPQMIVVTHDDEMETLSNNIIKVDKTNGISTIIS